MTINFPTTVDQLRTALLEAGDDPAKVATMKKGDLKTRLLELTADKLDFDLERIEEESPVETLESAIGVKYATPEWSSYVMGLFTQDELMDGYPKLNGLRRVANLVLGPIISSRATQVFVSQGDTRAVTVNYEIQIEWGLNTPVGFGNLGYNGEVRTFGGLGDCTEDLSSVFGRHPAATSESKAESRALRKALALNVIAAEEMMAGGSDEVTRPKATAGITSPMKTVILSKLSHLGLNLDDVLKDYGLNKSLESFNMEEARDLFEFINKYQQGK